MYHLSVGICDNGYYLYFKVRKGAMYHLSVGISENGYPFALIPTNKLYMGLFFALNSNNNCDVVPSSNLHDVYLPQKSPTVKVTKYFESLK